MSGFGLNIEKASIGISLYFTVLMLVASTPTIGLIAIFLIGLGAGNLFLLIFSMAVNKMPKKSNEISDLMIMVVSGGAFIP